MIRGTSLAIRVEHSWTHRSLRPSSWAASVLSGCLVTTLEWQKPGCCLEHLERSWHTALLTGFGLLDTTWASLGCWSDRLGLSSASLLVPQGTDWPTFQGQLSVCEQRKAVTQVKVNQSCIKQTFGVTFSISHSRVQLSPNEMTDWDGVGAKFQMLIQMPTNSWILILFIHVL